jgi:CHAT domain-containing protein
LSAGLVWITNSEELGARGVISTLWSVNAFATALFCIFYYEERKGNDDKKSCDRPTAIYNAQKRLREFRGAELGKDQPTRIVLDDYLNQQLLALGEESSEHEKERNQLNDLRKTSLPNLAKQSFPFNSPFYWSGFIAQGLA